MYLYIHEGAEGVVPVFYAIAKRRRDLNAAEEKGYKKGLETGRIEGHAEGRVAGFTAVLDEAAARFAEPGADPMAVIAQMRAELQNGASH